MKNLRAAETISKLLLHAKSIKCAKCWRVHRKCMSWLNFQAQALLKGQAKCILTSINQVLLILKAFLIIKGQSVRNVVSISFVIWLNEGFVLKTVTLLS